MLTIRRMVLVELGNRLRERVCTLRIYLLVPSYMEEDVMNVPSWLPWVFPSDHVLL